MKDKGMKKFLKWVLFIAISVPIFINILMFIDIFPVKGDTNTWISSLGTFWGAIIGGLISGAITLLGVRLTISDNNHIREKEKFPEKLFRLDKVIEFLGEGRKELQKLNALDFLDKKMFYFYIDENLNLKTNERYTKLTKSLLDPINSELVFVSAEYYLKFFELRKEYNDLFKIVIGPIEGKLFNLSNDIVESNLRIGNDVTKIKWIDLDRTLEQERKYQEIISELYRKERELIASQEEMITKLYFDLNDHYYKLIGRIDY